MDVQYHHLYRHFKGRIYFVHGIGRHTETNEEFVVYQTWSGGGAVGQIWIRPLEMFIGENEEGQQRFTHIGYAHNLSAMTAKQE